MDQIVEVADGLSANDRIINNPNAALMNGNKVRVVTPEPGYDLMNVPEPAQAPTHDHIKSEKSAPPSQEGQRENVTYCPIRDTLMQWDNSYKFSIRMLRIGFLLLLDILAGCNKFPGSQSVSGL